MEVPTLETIRTTVYRRLGRGSTTADPASEFVAEIDDHANGVLEDIYGAGDWWWKLVRGELELEEDEPAALLPADFHCLYLPYLLDEDRKVRIAVCRDPIEFERFRDTYTTTGTPAYAMVQWQDPADDGEDEEQAVGLPVLALVPTPDRDITIALPYKRKARILSDEDHRPNIPTWWVPAYLDNVTYHVALSRFGRETQERYRQRAKERWAAALEAEARSAHAGKTALPADSFDDLAELSQPVE